MAAKNLSLHLLFLFSIITISTARPDKCIFGIFVQTGPNPGAGTQSTISLTVTAASGQQLVVPDLKEWGLMGPGHNYFEVGNEDIFAVKDECLAGPICGVKITSDGSGPDHDWYVDYIEVTMFGAQNQVQKDCAQQHFSIDQWLASDTAPYPLTAARNACLRDEKRVSDGMISSVV